MKKIAMPFLLPSLLIVLGNVSIAFASDETKPAAGGEAVAEKTVGTQTNPTSGESSCSSAPASDSEMDRLLAILVQKKVLSQEEAANVRAEVKKQEQEPSAASTDANAQTTASSPNTISQTMGQDQPSTFKERSEGITEKLSFTISGYGQVQWTSLPGSNSTFQLRRGRISIDGDIHRLASYKIQVEALNSPSLLDAYLLLKPISQVKLTFGQFKVPFSQENLTSSRDLFTIERSQVVNNLVPGRDNGSQGRDIGADAGGSFNFSDSAGVDYAVGIFNGAGIDHKDDNNRKDAAVRLSLRPFQGLSLTGDYYNGAAGPTEAPRDRQGAEVTYTYHPVTLLGEFIWGRDGATHKQGWYGLAAWQFTKKWEGVFRADGYAPNRSMADNNTNTYLGGINWYFAQHLKWQINEGAQDQKNLFKNVFLTQLQFQY